ncbi:hypothetical protein P7F60_08550 [Rhizobium sp. YJ-22]|uniref:hypothetical protein n=1 Tax=Rhizobium sp. YJ-22 TaxID=3037556 RepID=UPI0024126721|nr:hypothetical protein [Rhizobium sp. YJ-22]MDG3576432.1 hypothetical protein [Rhizobium sp. YJ-22]
MRSLFKTLTITAFTVAGLAGLAQAAPHDGMHPGRQARAADEPYVDSVAPTMPVAFRAAPVMRPRLDAVLHEVRVAQHRIAMDRHEGRLTPAAARRLHMQAAGIRREALSIAATHHGRLPGATFAALQHDIRRLDRSITRMA